MIKSLSLTGEDWPKIGIEKNFYQNLNKNKDPGLNFICDAILNDKKFFNDN